MEETKPCPYCGERIFTTALKCKHCGEWLEQAKQVRQPMEQITNVPSSVPVEATKWNWGGFCFGWIWGIFNGVYASLLLIPIVFIPYVGPLLHFIGFFVLGAGGSRWAWKGRSWDSVEHFKRVQHNWAVFALVLFIISVIVGFFVIITVEEFLKSF